jgi:hypothetical protein
MDLGDEPHRHRVAIVIDAKADEDHLWTWARARLADLVADLRQPGIDKTRTPSPSASTSTVSCARDLSALSRGGRFAPTGDSPRPLGTMVLTGQNPPKKGLENT